MRPVLLRPPFFVSFSVSAFSGRDFVTSAKSDTDMWRRPGDVGLKRRTGISGSPRGSMSRGEPLELRSFEDLDRVAGAQLHDGLLPALAGALECTAPLRLRLNLDHVDARDLDVEELFDRLADLRLVRIGVDPERVAPARRVRIRLLADDRGEDDLARVHLLSLPLDERQRGLADEQRARPDERPDLDLGRADHDHTL